MTHSTNYTPFQIYSGQELTVRFEEDLLVFFGLKGTCILQNSANSYELGPAAVYAVNPLEIYRLRCPMDAAVICLRIPRDILQNGGWNGFCECYLPCGEVESGSAHLVRELYAELFQQFFENQTDAFFASKKIRELLHTLSSQYPTSNVMQRPRETTMKRLRRVLDRIEMKWNEDISLASIASEEYLSISYLSRFFQKNLQMSFSQYLKELRINHAAAMLVSSQASVTHIAYDCGFHAPSVFIEAFKQQYGQTPGQYRQESVQRQSDPNRRSSVHRDMSTLLAYLPAENTDTLPVRASAVEANCTGHVECRKEAGRRILNIGYAKDCLLAPVQEQILQAQREIGFEYIRFHGLFDEDMHIYWEDRQGNPQFSFYYMDLLFDFLQSVGIKPFVELSFMPVQIAREETRIFDRPSVISGCSNLEAWSCLVRASLIHLMERYGPEQVLTWRFTTICFSYVHLQFITREDYQQLFEITRRTVKEVHPDLQFGGPGCFAEWIDHEQGLPAFLRFAADRNCEPDFITFQFYPHKNTYDSLFMDFTLSQQSSPAVLSDDPDYLLHALNSLEKILKDFRLQELEIYIEESTSTLWQRDLSGDTCYKAAWLAKNMTDCWGRAVFGYWLLTDLLEERARIESVFHGGYGLFTYSGIPKAAYRSMQFFRLLGDKLVARGDGWFLTESSEGYQLLLYNYSHYSNLYLYRYQRLEDPEDAYSVFESGEIRQFHISLKQPAEGLYRLERRKLNREHGSSFDRWLEFGAPRSLSQEETRYLKENSAPLCTMERLRADRSVHLESRLEPHNVELIRLIRIHS